MIKKYINTEGVTSLLASVLLLLFYVNPKSIFYKISELDALSAFFKFGNFVGDYVLFIIYNTSY